MLKEREALSVTQINLYVKELIARDDVLCDVLIKGEISNFKAHTSGHMYMSLKDDGGVIRAVMFRSSAAKLRFLPENGMKVIAKGRIGVYERDGQYQLYIDSMQKEGQGDLYAAFELLKEKLSKEGLFNPEHKKPIVKYPEKIGVVTAATGAAIRDIINVLSRRFRLADIVLYPVLVQGEGAASEIAGAIDYFNAVNGADVLIVGRGGGSIEDLWAFNEEIVARAVYNSKIPVISAVGHEIDFTIIDFVADLRAPTPSAAAELAVPAETELREKISNIYDILLKKSNDYIKDKRLLLSRFETSVVFRKPKEKTESLRQRTDGLSHMLDTYLESVMKEKKLLLSKECAKLDALSPVKTLARGYSIVKGSDGTLIRSEKQVNAGDTVDVVLNDGGFAAEVKERR